MIPLLYALITSWATLTGGVLPVYTRLKLVKQRYLVTFASGAMVAIALFDFIPEMETHMPPHCCWASFRSTSSENWS